MIEFTHGSSLRGTVVTVLAGGRGSRVVATAVETIIRKEDEKQ